MIIKKKSIRNVEKYLSDFVKGSTIRIGLKITEEAQKKLLKKVGFTNEFEIGERVLPAIVGSKTRFNSNGGYNLLRDLPKETYYMEKDWETLSQLTKTQVLSEVLYSDRIVHSSNWRAEVSSILAPTN